MGQNIAIIPTNTKHIDTAVHTYGHALSYKHFQSMRHRHVSVMLTFAFVTMSIAFSGASGSMLSRTYKKKKDRWK